MQRARISQRRTLYLSEMRQKAEVYSRITGYYRPVQNWNDGKAQEYKTEPFMMLCILP